MGPMALAGAFACAPALALGIANVTDELALPQVGARGALARPAAAPVLVWPAVAAPRLAPSALAMLAGAALGAVCWRTLCASEGGREGSRCSSTRPEAGLLRAPAAEAVRAACATFALS